MTFIFKLEGLALAPEIIKKAILNGLQDAILGDPLEKFHNVSLFDQLARAADQ